MERTHNCICETCGACHTMQAERLAIAEQRLGYYVMTCPNCLMIPQKDRQAVMIAKIKVMERRTLCKRDVGIILRYPSLFNGMDPLRPYWRQRNNVRRNQ
jgi:Zn-finger protein